jgi:hypothetical protein
MSNNYVYVGPGNKAVLYVKLQKALYGCLRSALLFYLKLLGDLEANGFTLNPYDPCVANKMVNGKQFTTTWYVDDLELSHVDDKEVTKMIVWLKNIYGNDMRVSRGKKHDYLGMDLDFTEPGQVKITMIPYLKGVIRDFPEEITGRATSPVADIFSPSERTRTESPWMKAAHWPSTLQSHNCCLLVPALGRTSRPPLHF